MTDAEKLRLAIEALWRIRELTMLPEGAYPFDPRLDEAHSKRAWGAIQAEAARAPKVIRY